MKFIKHHLGKILLTLFAVSFLGYWYASPYIAGNMIEQAVLQRNSEKLAKFINFPELRQSLSAQIRNQLLVKAQEDASVRQDEKLLSAADLVADKIVQDVVTPSGFIALVSGEMKADQLANDAQNSISETSRSGLTAHKFPADQNSGDLRNRFAFHMNYSPNFDHFFVTIENPRLPKEKVEISLGRIGFFSWQVDNVLLPFSP